MRSYLLVTLATLLTKALLSQNYQVNDIVEIEWKGKWYDGKVLEKKSNGTYLVSYDGFDSSWNETLVNSRIRKKTKDDSVGVLENLNVKGYNDVYLGKGSTLQLDISKDGKTLFAAGNSALHVVDAGTMQLIKELKSPGKSLIHFVDYNDVSKTVLVGCGAYGGALLYDLETENIIWQQQNKANCWGLCWIPDSDNAVIASSNEKTPTQIDVEIWDLKKKKKILTLLSFNTGQSSFGGLSVNDNLIAIALVYENAGIYFYEHSGKKVKRMGYSKQINALHFIGNTNDFVFANDNKQAFFYDYNSLKEGQKFNGVDDYIQGLSVSSDLRFLVLGGGRTKTISAKLYDFKNGKLIKEIGNQVDLLDVVFSPFSNEIFATFNYNDNFPNHILIQKFKL